MTIGAHNFFSWQVAAWFAGGSVIVAVCWVFAARMQVMWQRVFLRAGIIALCFAPLPAVEMFTEAARAGHFMIVPLWYALFWSITSGALLGGIIDLILWLVIAYFLLVIGMCIHHLFWRSHAA